MAAATPQQQQVARLIYAQGAAAGLPPARDEELVAAAYAETGGTLDPHAINSRSGAAGLFQLLSDGYRQAAARLGGLYDPVANTRAILPNYEAYWRDHPNAAPGEAAAYVEASGEGPAFYAAPLSTVRGLLAGGGPSQAGAGGPLPASLSAAPGVDVADVNPTLWQRLGGLLSELGLHGTIVSGYRDSGHAGAAGFEGDPHSRGLAADVNVNGKPIADVIPWQTISSHGLRTGSDPRLQPFYQGTADPEHVDLLDPAGHNAMAGISTSFGPGLTPPPAHFNSGDFGGGGNFSAADINASSKADTLAACWGAVTSGFKWYEPWTYGAPVVGTGRAIGCTLKWLALYIVGWLERLGLIVGGAALVLVGLYLVARSASGAPEVTSLKGAVA